MPQSPVVAALGPCRSKTGGEAALCRLLRRYPRSPRALHAGLVTNTLLTNSLTLLEPERALLALQLTQLALLGAIKSPAL